MRFLLATPWSAATSRSFFHQATCRHGIFPLLTILALAFLTGCASPRLTHGIPNFAIVEPGMYRGGQPTAEGWAWLKAQGVTYEVKLNTWTEASDIPAFNHNIFIQDDGIIDLWHQTFAKPNAYAVASAVQSLRNYSGTTGIFVHCQHGQDRTGLIVACYRVQVEHWPKADAEKEMLAHGFHKSLHGLWEYWKEEVP